LGKRRWGGGEKKTERTQKGINWGPFCGGAKRPRQEPAVPPSRTKKKK